MKNERNSLDTSGAYKVKLADGIHTIVLRPGWHYVVGYTAKRFSSDVIWMTDAQYVGRLDTRLKYVFLLPNGEKRYIHENALQEVRLTVKQLETIDREEILQQFRERSGNGVGRTPEDARLKVTSAIAKHLAQKDEIDDMLERNSKSPEDSAYYKSQRQQRGVRLAKYRKEEKREED